MDRHDVKFVLNVSDKIKQAVTDLDNERIRKLLNSLKGQHLKTDVILGTRIALFVTQLKKLEGMDEATRRKCKEIAKEWKATVQSHPEETEPTEMPTVQANFVVGKTPKQPVGKSKFDFSKMARLQDSQASKSKRQQLVIAPAAGSRKRATKVLKLQTLCLHILMQNVDKLGYLGHITEDLLNPIVKKATPEQLKRIEDANPDLGNFADALWKDHCKKTFSIFKPDEGQTWRQTFEKRQFEKEKRKNDAFHRGTAALKNISHDSGISTTKSIDFSKVRRKKQSNTNTTKPMKKLSSLASKVVHPLKRQKQNPSLTHDIRFTQQRTKAKALEIARQQQTFMPLRKMPSIEVRNRSHLAYHSERARAPPNNGHSPMKRKAAPDSSSNPFLSALTKKSKSSSQPRIKRTKVASD